ncbi:MAG: EamA family transporter, partial [Acidimicrobiales bacterium]
PGRSGLALAMVVGAAATLPAGLAAAGARLLEPAVLGMGVGVAILSSALPYSLELAALRRLTPRAFGILMSMDPALAALVGFAVLGQRLSLTEVAALVLVAAANAGSSAADARSGSPTPPTQPGVRASANG